MKYAVFASVNELRLDSLGKYIAALEDLGIVDNVRPIGEINKNHECRREWDSEKQYHLVPEENQPMEQDTVEEISRDVGDEDGYCCILRMRVLEDKKFLAVLPKIDERFNRPDGIITHKVYETTSACDSSPAEAGSPSE